jgi:lambda family phage tail tape measure protein
LREGAAVADVEVARLTARDETKAAFDSVRRGIKDMEGSANKLRNVFAGLGVTLSAGAFVAVVKNSIDAADALNKLSQKVGVSVEGLSKLQYAAQLSDVSTEDLSTGLRKLSISLEELRTSSTSAVAAFGKLGLTQQDLAGKNVEEAFSKIADSIKGIDVATRNNGLNTVFGKSFSTLIPLLNSGAAGLKAVGDEAQRFGAVVSTDTARAAEAFNDNLTRMRKSLEGLVVTLTGNIIGPLAKFTNELVDASKAAGGFSQAMAQMLAGEAGNDAGRKLVETEERIRAIRIERDKLANSKAPSGSLQRLLGGATDEDLAREEASLVTLRDRLKILQNIRAERAAADAAPDTRKGGKSFDVPDESKAAAAAARAAAARKRAADQAERENIERAQREGKAIFDTYQTEVIQPLEATFQASKQRESLIGDLISVSQIEQVKKIREQIRLLGEAGKDAPLEMQASFEQTFEALNDQLQKALGKLDGSQFKTVATDGTKAFKDLQTAIEGWGRKSADVFADFVTGGKASFSDLIQSMIREAIALQAYKAIFGPLFGAIGGMFGGAAAGGGSKAFGGLAKGGAFNSSGVQRFAMGGLVSSPQLFMAGNGIGLMGEAGPEAIMPLKRGPDGRLGVQSNGGGGGTFVVVNVDSRSDAAYVRDQVRRGVAVGIAQERDTKRRGRG